MGYPALLGIFIVSSVSISLCFYVSLSLFLPSVSPKPNLTLNMAPFWPAHQSLPLSHPPPPPPPPLLYPDKKFPVEAHFWLDELFYYIDIQKHKFQLSFWETDIGGKSRKKRQAEFTYLYSISIFQIKNPHSHKPSLKFGTIPSSYSEVTLKKEQWKQ